MCQSDNGDLDTAENEVIAESVDYWRTRLRDAESAISRLSSRLRGRDQRILQLERALARTVALHHALEDSLEQRLEQCSEQGERVGEPDRSGQVSPDRTRNGVIMRLPHLTRTLSLIVDVMWRRARRMAARSVPRGRRRYGARSGAGRVLRCEPVWLSGLLP